MAWARRGQQRGSTAQRGYSGEHQRLRAQWKPKVDAGGVMCHAVICLKPTRWIVPGTPWHLGHTADRAGWTGPEHEQCNESDGARRGNSRRRQQYAVSQLAVSKAAGTRAATVTTAMPLRTSRNW